VKFFPVIEWLHCLRRLQNVVIKLPLLLVNHFVHKKTSNNEFAVESSINTFFATKRFHIGFLLWEFDFPKSSQTQGTKFRSYIQLGGAMVVYFHHMRPSSDHSSFHLERQFCPHAKTCCWARVVTSHEKFLVGNHFRDDILILHRLNSFSLKTFVKWRNGPQSFLTLM